MLETTLFARSNENKNEIPAQHRENSSDRILQRAEGACRIVVGGSSRGTCIMDVFQKSPMRVVFPNTGDDRSREAVLLNTSGGIAGADRLQSEVTALGTASLAVTTQAAEKIHRAIDAPAEIKTTLKLCDSAKLAWLPQETIVFNEARVRRRTEIDISPGSELLALEWFVLGRTARGESMLAGSITDTWLVRKNGRLIWGDTLRLTDVVLPHLPHKALLSDSKAIATLLCFGEALEARQQLIRDLSGSLDCQCGATLVGGLLVARFAARSSFELKTALRHLLEEFRKQMGPGPFRVPKMWLC